MKTGTALALAVAAVAAVAHPALLPPDADSFPLSNYPMFARARARTEELPRAVVVDAGEKHVLPPEAYGTDNVMQTISMLWAAVHGRGETPAALCERLAASPQARARATTATAEVQVALARIDVIEYFRSDRGPGSEHVLARCPLHPGQGSR